MAPKNTVCLWFDGQASTRGWRRDRWGPSWQITPRALTAAITDPDPAATKRAFEAMMTMTRIDIAAIEAARRGRWAGAASPGRAARHE